MTDLLVSVPLWLSILSGVLGGLIVVGLHLFAGWMATRTMRRRPVAYLAAAALVAGGLVVGTVLTFNTSANAVAAQVGIGRCT